MSQRIHSCVNNTKLETIHCDAYASKLHQKNEKLRTKTVPTRQMRERSMCTRSTTLRRDSANSPTEPTKPEELVCKELYTNSAAMVEVTVKTHNNPRQRSRSNSRDNWGKILKSQSSTENVSQFTYFDPLRTIHFLSKELEHKLRQCLPNDSNVLNLISEMQLAIGRLPTEVSSSEIVNTLAKAINRDGYDMKPTKLLKNSDAIRVIKQGIIDNSTQTPKGIYDDTPQNYKYLEESSERIEKACAQMEELCAKLKLEKEEIEAALLAEKEVVKLLHKQIDEQNVKYSTQTTLLDILKIKNDELETEILKLKEDMEMRQQKYSAELKTFIQELHKEKSKADEECIEYKQKLTLSQMETEKLKTILQARDAQVKEIRTEMTQLQEVINEQLMELENNPYSSDVSTFSGIPSGTWQEAEIKSAENSVADSKDEVFKSFKDLDSGDSSLASELTHQLSENEKNKSNKLPKTRKKSKMSLQDSQPITNAAMNIRDRFTEIKKQALHCIPGKSK